LCGAGYSGAVFWARELAKQKNTGAITYNVPKEGSQQWFQAEPRVSAVI
jgi:hypothetical protein